VKNHRIYRHDGTETYPSVRETVVPEERNGRCDTDRWNDGSTTAVPIRLPTTRRSWFWMGRG